MNKDTNFIATSLLYSILIITLTNYYAQATISIKLPFTSHMVLQRNASVKIWGTGATGESVTVKLAGQSVTAVTGADKNWKLQLEPMKAAGPLTLTITGTNTITLTDVYIGEVWQCAGQSNMDLTLNSTEWKGAFDAEISSADYPAFRYMKTRGTPAGWNVISPSTAGGCSATGYFFGKELLEDLDCAVGIIVTAVGGTLIEQWFDPVTTKTFEGKIDGSIHPGDMFDQYVKPVIPFTIRGTVWIQGEQNASKAIGVTDYGDRFSSLITNWRKAWGQGDFPFYYGQLTGINSAQSTPFPNSSIALVREGQRKALLLPETAMSVMLDISAGGWHYANKREAGRRLSLAPKSLLYGQTKEYCGPLFDNATVSGNKVTIRFTHAEGLTTNDGKIPAQIGIAGAGGTWYFADKAEIIGNTIVASSVNVAAPLKICMGWNDKPRVNVYNKDGLQASPFVSETVKVTSLQNWSDDAMTGTSVIYPNPVAGNDLLITNIRQDQNTVVRVLDLSGRTILTHYNFSNRTDASEVLLDITEVPKGSFVVEIRDNLSFRTFRMIRQ